MRLLPRLSLVAVFRRLRPLAPFLRLAPIALLVGLTIAFRHDVARAAARLRELHPIVFAIVPLYVLWNHIAGYGWRSLIAATAPDRPPVTALRLSVLRLQAQAVNMALPALVGIGGGAVRVGFTRGVGLAPASAAAVLDDIASAVAGLLFVAAGLLLLPGSILGIPHAAIAAIAAAGGTLVWLGIVVLAPVLAARVRPDRPLANALRVLSQNRRRLVPAFAVAVGWHLAERVVCAGEIYLAFLAAGTTAGPTAAVYVQAVSVAVSLMLFFLPGQPGAADAAIVAACASVGLDPSTGLTVALIRRARQLAVIGVGLVSLAVSRHRDAATPAAEAP